MADSRTIFVTSKSLGLEPSAVTIAGVEWNLSTNVVKLSFTGPLQAGSFTSGKVRISKGATTFNCGATSWAAGATEIETSMGAAEPVGDGWLCASNGPTIVGQNGVAVPAWSGVAVGFVS